MKKHLLSFILLALAALSQTLPAMAEFTKSYTSGGIYYMLDTKAKTAQVVYNAAHKNLTTLNLPSLVVYNNDSYDIVSIDAKAFENCTNLTSATIPFKVTYIASTAFDGCTSLSKMTYNAAVAPDNFLWHIAPYLTEFEIGAMYDGTNFVSTWFKGCTKLKKFTSRNKITLIAEEAFKGCTGLETFTCYNIERVGANAFQGCTSLTNASCGIDVEYIGNEAFQGCSSLTAFLFGSATNNIGVYAFEGCSSLKKLDLSKSKIEEVKEGTFQNCQSLESILLPNTVQKINSYSFAADKKLASFTIPSSVTTIGYYAFMECESLETLVIPSSVTNLTPDSKHAFWNMSGLKTIDFSQSNVKTIDLFNCANLETVKFPAGYDGTISFRDCPSLTSVDLSNTKVTSIPDDCFRNCSSLKSISLPSTITEVGRNAFNSTAITSINWPQKVNIIPDSCFMNCNSLTTFTIPSNVTTIGERAFSDCDALHTVIAEPETAPTFGTDAFKSLLTPDNRKLVTTSSSAISSYTQAGYDNYFTLNLPAPTSVAINPSRLTLYANTEGAQITATVFPSNADPRITFSSSKPEIATISEDGFITPLQVGYTIITATTSNGLTAQGIIFVQDVTSIELSETERTITLQDTLQLVATVLPTEASQKIVWSSSNPEVASVNEKGLVRALAAGTTTITATTSNGLTATCTITVETPVVTSIEISETERTITLQDTLQLVATVLPAEASQEIVWSSSNPEVASVNEKGLVRALAAGTTTITATTSNGLTATCTITVETPVVTPDGDVNSDGKINSTDIVAIYNRIQLGDTSGLNLKDADVNNDGKVNSADVVAVYNLIIGGGE